MSLIIILFALYLYFLYKQYEKSSYKNYSDKNFLEVRFDKGLYGEFLTYLKLEKNFPDMKLVPNAYIKKKNNVTTEIDLIGVHKTGIYVFESKNYGGWIFGNGNSKYWMQTFKTGQKNKFFNPVWQNDGHINALSYYLGDLDINNPFKSVIVFGQRCTLKKVNNIKDNVIIFKRFFLKRKIKQCIDNFDYIFNERQVIKIYKKIELCSYVDKEVKENQIKYIKKHYK